MNTMDLTEHFSFHEVEFSRDGLRLGIDNALPTDFEANARRVARDLEVIRTKVGPILVHSWFRCPKVNKLVSGASDSAHLEARGVDITVAGMRPIDLARVILALPELQRDQVILEFPPEGWVHYGIARQGEPARGQVMTASNVPSLLGVKKVYTVGLNA